MAKGYVKQYPPVIGEFDTIRQVVQGKSLARFGDGELKMAYGASYMRENGNESISRELRVAIRNTDPRCIVGIPTLDPRGPKYKNWIRHRQRFKNLLSPKVEYYSAFVSRPDSAPWISSREYANLVVSIWKGKNVVVVSEPANSLLALVRASARNVAHIECPHRDAYQHISDFEQRVHALKPDVAILSIGVTATCLAYRLALGGMHAVDLGSAGGFLLKLLNPKKKTKAAE